MKNKMKVLQVSIKAEVESCSVDYPYVQVKEEKMLGSHISIICALIFLSLYTSSLLLANLIILRSIVLRYQ